MCRFPFFYAPAVPGSIAPVAATDDMTQPVGIRDCRLFTKPGDAVVTDFENRLSSVESKADLNEDDIDTLQGDMEDVEADISNLDTRVTNLENATPTVGGGNAYAQVASQFSIALSGGQIMLSLTHTTLPQNAVVDSIDIVVMLHGPLVHRAFTLYNATNNQFVLSSNGTDNGRVLFEYGYGSSGNIAIMTLLETNNTLWTTNLSDSDIPTRAVIHYHIPD